MDLPQLWQRPSYEELVNVLRGLELALPTWSGKHVDRQEAARRQESYLSQQRGEVTRYLSTIVCNGLDWIESEEEKETVWQMASRRISERCGRGAMGDIVRTWQFDGDAESFELAIKEPGLTEATLGLKTWGSSYVLAQHLGKLGSTSLFRLFDESLGQPAPTVLELGSGTGLLGLAAAAIWKTLVFLSDLPKVVGNLKDNAERNAVVLRKRGGDVCVGALTWGGCSDEEIDATLFGEPFQFPIVLVADPLYFDDHPVLLASAIAINLALGRESRAVVMVPKRDNTTVKLIEMFKQTMLDLESPLFCEEEDELEGEDDYGRETGEDGEPTKIGCWLGIFSRGGTPAERSGLS